MSIVGALIAVALTPAVHAQDWPMWGRTPTRNMSTHGESDLTIDFYPGDFIGVSDEKLQKEGVTFVPSTKIGEDVHFKELVEDWGFSAVVLANGAWRDRPVPVDGAEEYVGNGLVYQNPFVIAFNHDEKGDMPDAKYEIHDGAIILGGGLASIDVAKIHTLQRTVEVLRERGVETDVEELEIKGIPKILEKHGIESPENKGRVVFILAEFQVLDRATARQNEQGESAHALYKQRQHGRERGRHLGGGRASQGV